MIGYDVCCQDNDSYAFRDRPGIREDTPWYELHQSIAPNMSGAPRRGVKRCAVCGELLDKWNERLTGLRIKKRCYDISCTYDGIDVVSRRFKEVYEASGLEGLLFIQLPDDPDCFQIQATHRVAFDAERRKTRFIKQCPKCGHFESVVGATPVYLKTGQTIPDRGFVWTDLEFGSDDGKSPILLCGVTAGRVLEEANLSGLDLAEV